MTTDAALLAVAGVVAGLGLTATLPRRWWSAPAARLHRRLERYTQSRPRARPGTGLQANPIFGERSDNSEPWLKRAWRAQVLRIGGSRRARLLILVAILAGVVAAAVLARTALLDPVTALFAGAASAAGLLFILVRQATERWKVAFLENFNDAIDLIIRAVRAGIPVSEAVRQAGTEVNEPVSSEFRRIADSIDLGVDMRDALRQAADRVRLPDFDFFVVCLVVQRETGGQLTDTLEGLTQILRRRKEIRLKVRALTAEGRATATIVAALPVVTGLLMLVLNPEYMARLLEPGFGRTMLLYGAVSMVTGLVIINQLARFRA